MKKIKIIIGSIVAAIIVGLGTTTAVMSNHINKLNCEIAEATTNIKAYELENSALKDDTIEFQYTIDMLNYSKDSLNQKINSLKKDLKIQKTISIVWKWLTAKQLENMSKKLGMILTEKIPEEMLNILKLT